METSLKVRSASREGAARPSAGTAGAVIIQLREELMVGLHDGPARKLQAALVMLEALRRRAAPPERADLRAVQDQVREAVSMIRDIAQDLALDAHDAGSGRRDVRRALAAVAASFEKETGIRTRLRVAPDFPHRLRVDAVRSLLGIAEEALENVRRHSDARRAEIAISVRASRMLCMGIRDDGVGLPLVAARGPRSLGLRGMQERALLLGGTVAMIRRPGGGTLLQAVFEKESLE